MSLSEGQHIECTSDIIVKQSEDSELVQIARGDVGRVVFKDHSESGHIDYLVMIHEDQISELPAKRGPFQLVTCVPWQKMAV